MELVFYNLEKNFFEDCPAGGIREWVNESQSVCVCVCVYMGISAGSLPAAVSKSTAPSLLDAYADSSVSWSSKPTGEAPWSAGEMSRIKRYFLAVGVLLLVSSAVGTSAHSSLDN